MTICKRKQKWQKIQIKLILVARQEKLTYWRYQEHDTQFVAAGYNVSKNKNFNNDDGMELGEKLQSFCESAWSHHKNVSESDFDEWMNANFFLRIEKFLKNFKSLRSQLCLLKAKEIFTLTQRSHLESSSKKVIYVVPTVLRGCESYCVCCFSVQISNKVSKRLKTLWSQHLND